MEQKKAGKLHWMIEKRLYIIVIAVISALYLGFMVIGQIAPFGDNSSLMHDAYVQVYPMAMEFRRKVWSGDSIFYSWHMGIGCNYYANVLYYLMSPINWLVLLVPESGVLSVLHLITGMKLSLAGVSMLYYVRHTETIVRAKGAWDNKWAESGVYVFLSLAYALSNAVLAYSFMTMWMEIYILLPLLMLGIEKLARHGKWQWFYVVLVLTLVMNFYLAFPVCVFAVLWFFYQLQSVSPKRMLQFVGTAILSACTAAFALVPAFYMVMMRWQGGEGTVDFSAMENVADLLNAYLPLSPLQTLGAGYDTFNVYCGTGSILFALGYFIWGTDSKVNKVKSALLLLILNLSLCSRIGTYIWHGFTLPHGFQNRFAFIVVVFAIYLGAKALLETVAWNVKKMIGVILGTVLYLGIVLVLTSVLSGPEVYLVALFMWVIIWMLLVFGHRKSITKVQCQTMLIYLCIIELAVSSVFVLTQYGVRSSDHDASRYITDSKETDARMVSTNMLTISGLLNNTNSTGMFSSLNNGNVLELYRDLGLYYNRDGGTYLYNGGTPFTDFLWNIKGAESNYGLLLDTVASELSLQAENPFLNQNQCFAALGGEGNLFEEVTFVDCQVEGNLCVASAVDDHHIAYENIIAGYQDGSIIEYDTMEEFMAIPNKKTLMNGAVSISFEVAKPMDLYLYSADANGELKAVYVDGELVTQDDYVSFGYNVHVGEVKPGQVISVTTGNQIVDGTSGVIRIYGGAYQESAFQAWKDKVNAEAVQVTSLDGSGLKAKVTCDQNTNLFLSAIQDGGFTVYVDGKKQDSQVLADSFTYFPIEAGVHEIKVSYCPPGLMVGGILSLIGVIIAIGLWRRDEKSVFLESNNVKNEE